MGSVWKETTTNKKDTHNILTGNINTDVLIIGGGMVGILIAHRLIGTGLNCIIVEGRKIGAGVTSNTTAKITAQHGLIYSDLIKRFGIEKAHQYFDANTQAIKAYRSLAVENDCDFEEKTAYVYSINNREALEQEAKAYYRLGIPAYIEETPPLPFKTAGALALKGQAQFNPLKLLYGLADKLEIYEDTFVQKIEGQTAYVDKGTIQAKKIVLATHYPLINIPGLYFVKLYQHRSYVTAYEGAPLIDGMYLDEQENGHSFRTYGNLLFIGGGDHKTGKRGGGYAELRSLAASAYPNATERYFWSTQDCMTLDNVPYVGRHRSGKNSLYVATGFNKWGMTGAMVAAEIIHDLIRHGKSELEDLYSPQRSILTKQLFVNLGAAASGLLRIGRPRCSHMGCKLNWNKTEKSWDCPCHGSRFDKRGSVIDNPAKKGIRIK